MQGWRNAQFFLLPPHDRTNTDSRTNGVWSQFVRTQLAHLKQEEPVVLVMDDDGSTPISNPTILSLSMHRAMLLFAQAGNRADLCSYPGASSAPLHRTAVARASARRNTCFSDKTPGYGTRYKWLLARQDGGRVSGMGAFRAVLHGQRSFTRHLI